MPNFAGKGLEIADGKFPKSAESGPKAGDKKHAPRNHSARIFVCKTAADYDRAPTTASAEIEKHKNAAKYRGCGAFSATRSLGKKHGKRRR